MVEFLVIFVLLYGAASVVGFVFKLIVHNPAWLLAILFVILLFAMRH